MEAICLVSTSDKYFVIFELDLLGDELLRSHKIWLVKKKVLKLTKLMVIMFYETV